MSRIPYSIVFAAVCLFAGHASADFMELPAAAPSFSADVSASEAELSAKELRSDSGYLELGYYAVDGRTPALHLARPEDAGVGDAVAEAGLWNLGLGSLSAPSAPLAFAALVLALAAAAFATRRHWLRRS
jgi:hypothetical protein